MRAFSLLLKTSAFLVIFSGILLFIPNGKAMGGVIVVAPEQVKAVQVDQTTSLDFPMVQAASDIPVRQRSHAPEPQTLLLFFSGMMGMIVHAARRSFRAAKRALDHIAAAVAIVLTAPIFIVIALLVRITSKGPVIYRQVRVGKDGKLFEMYKFRSMRVDAEQGTGAVWAKQNDPRVTPIGNFLRKSHLDELPQLFNVLKGEMSIVGPRPERPEMVRDLKEKIVDYEKRLEVLPGITGLAQVMHRYDETLLDVKTKVKYDLLYIRKMCWLAEMRIWALTCVVMMTGKAVR